MRECRVGSLPWFAGVWWFVWGCALHAAARGLLLARAPSGLVWRTIGASQRCLRAAVRCAVEGGAEW